MERMTLNFIYKLKYFDYDTFHIENVMCDNFFPNDWIDANVPEDVHTTLRRYGYLSGHYYDKDLDQERRTGSISAALLQMSAYTVMLVHCAWRVWIRSPAFGSMGHCLGHAKTCSGNTHFPWVMHFCLGRKTAL